MSHVIAYKHTQLRCWTIITSWQPRIFRYFSSLCSTRESTRTCGLGPSYDMEDKIFLARLCIGAVRSPVSAGFALATLPPSTWHNEHVGKRECTVVDTFWQTETGSIVATPLPGAIETKPGSVTVPSFGIEPTILDPVKGKESEGNNIEGVLVLKTPWPAIACTVYKERYLDISRQ
ncbi:acetate-coa synthetase [Laccaria bicolor S238N-H82]|uniref:acetate--CoA ligase n=1 Tax=Laccaria bicolor (strain S238N-H82 / ATCC MYA-4686) TaxID=486041 RepID=B0DFV7_LACBS|nr:acetate-coa synthetase [Laccaria bicolor S238N-H82]EDR06411.1 acetate-coa synthetase [Laccaria bicolor S238N-H82]|eukprot:XP_001882783.1 acetate-coa synthetase [Laccaria bicolor S238N-H82]